MQDFLLRTPLANHSECAPSIYLSFRLGRSNISHYVLEVPDSVS